MQTKLAFLNFLLASAATGAFAAPTPTGLNLPDLSVIAPPVVSTLPDSIFHLPSLDALSSRDAKFNDLSARVDTSDVETAGEGALAAGDLGSFISSIFSLVRREEFRDLAARVDASDVENAGEGAFAIGDLGSFISSVFSLVRREELKNLAARVDTSDVETAGEGALAAGDLGSFISSIFSLVRRE